MYRTMEYEINELSHHVDANHIQACTDLEKASQFLTEALLSETQRSSALRRLIHRLEQRAAENGRSLSEQVESNRQLKLQVDELQKQLEDKDNSLTQAKQSISILKNELRELQQQQQQQQQQQSHQSSHRTIQDVTEWLQDGESQTIVASIVKEEESVLQNPGVGIKKEEDAYDGYPCMQIEEDGITTEQTSYSSADIEVELPQVEDEMSDMAPVDSSEMSQSESPDPARSLRSSMQLVKRSTSATQDQQATTSKDHQDGKRPNAGGGLQLTPEFPAEADPEADAEMQNEGGPYYCSFCGLGFSEENAMRTHLEYHAMDVQPDLDLQIQTRHQYIRTAGQKAHLCKYCSQCFSSADGLRQHKHIHKKEERPYHCTYCSKTFARLGHLRVHLATHTGDKPYRCSQCSKSFSQAGNLKRHQSVHTGPYHCNPCGKSFSQIECYNKHLRLHQTDKPYPCDQCDRRFQRLKCLEIHRRIHTGEKPYACHLCGKSFSQLGSLNRHQLIHKERRPMPTPTAEVPVVKVKVEVD
ncbi:zinc finger and SCAN domain-containing protein 21-like isoform X3 [Engraulis encrasicolus]|uniref:zinc finger and SCAN domain-containing protein 21-like isoform X3 n=1 Tax=Engraulis encrasicolus TaxID=184585 RepID=UPI002FD207BC